jgi:hypothetical protein
MSDSLNSALSDPGPHTVDALVKRLPHFPREAVEQALEALTSQGVLEKWFSETGEAQYRYVAPERYVQINRDVIVNPGAPHNRPRRG